MRHIYLNPLWASLVGTLKELDRYPYSGHSGLVGRMDRSWQACSEVLKRYGGSVGLARQRYREYVSEGVGQGRRPELMGGGLVRSAGGWDAVRSLRRGRESFFSDERVLGSGSSAESLLREVEEELEERYRARRSRVTLERLMGRSEAEMGLASGELHSQFRGRKASKGRSLLAYPWMEVLGRSGREMAQN